MSSTKITIEVPDELLEILRDIAAKEHMNQTEAIKSLLKGVAKMDSVDAYLALGIGKQALPHFQEQMTKLAGAYESLAGEADYEDRP